MSDHPLNAIEKFIRRFLVLPREEHYWIMTLWVAHTYFTEHLTTTPRLAFISPEYGCGKSVALLIIKKISFRGQKHPYYSRSALMRRITDVREECGKPPTFCLDEMDTVFKGQATEASEAIRLICNEGYRAEETALITETVGKTMEPTEFELFAPMALAGKGDIIPDSVKTRGIEIRVQRRLPHERVEDFLTKAVNSECEELREWLSSWSDSVGEDCETANVQIEGVEDRPREVWLPLYAVARLADEEWVDKFHSALTLVTVIQQEAEKPFERQLLEDCLEVCGETENIRTESLLNGLKALPERDYKSFRNEKGIDARWLAKKLRLYDIRPKQIRFGDETAKGYSVHEIRKVLERYAPAPTPETSETLETSETSLENSGLSVFPIQHTSETLETSEALF